MRNELKFQRLESLLSALLIATEDGLIQVYTGGFLFAIVLKIPVSSAKCRVLQVDTTRSLQSFQFLVNQCDGSARCLSLSTFNTDHFKKVSSIVGPLGFKYTFFLKSWSLIQSEVNNLNDHWGKLVEIYQGYMTYGADKELNEVKADYMELLFTGISTVELEIFLGKAGREKEIKKHTNAVNSISGSMMEHFRNIKCAIVLALMDLNEIGGFLKFSRVDDARDVVADLRKALSYLYIGILHIQVLIQSFVEKFLHFFHLLLNTVHFFNIQEAPDFIEEDSDVDSVLEFLDLHISNSIFEFLIQNAAHKFKNPPPCLQEVHIPVSSASKKATDLGANAPQFPFVRLSADQRWKSFPAFMGEYMQTHSDEFVGKNLILDFSQEEVMKLFSNSGLPSTVNTLIEDLLRIPALSTLPFSAAMYPIAAIPGPDEECVENSNVSRVRIKQSATSSIIYFHTHNITYLFEISFKGKSPTAKSYSLRYSKGVVTSCDLFSDSVLSILSVTNESESVESKDIDSGSGTIFQINLEKVLESSAVVVDLQKFLSNSKQKFAPTEVTVELSSSSLTDSTKGSEQYGLIESSVVIDAFVPGLMAVSGARKLGAVLSSNKKQLLLVDMEPEAGDNSYDDEGTAEFSSETLSEVSL